MEDPTPERAAHRVSALVKERVCKDCEPGSKRPAPQPGPRCATHWRAFKAATKVRNHELRVQKVYGLGDGDYDALCEMQDGLCAICRRARCVGSTGKHLAVDHDHSTGAPRGLLCMTCNRTLIGQYDEAALVRAIAYLNNPPYRRLLARRMHATPEETR